ncbi:MAG: hypothetical protein AAGA56_24070 [Myxococcota bacterium]
MIAKPKFDHPRAHHLRDDRRVEASPHGGVRRHAYQWGAPRGSAKGPYAPQPGPAQNTFQPESPYPGRPEHSRSATVRFEAAQDLETRTFLLGWLG